MPSIDVSASIVTVIFLGIGFGDVSGDAAESVNPVSAPGVAVAAGSTSPSSTHIVSILKSVDQPTEAG